MRFRPCIDIHNGKVKQIVGGSLSDKGDLATENFASEHRASYYASLYKKDRLEGGHMILLNPVESAYYQENKMQALEALDTFKGGLQVGGGITSDNAKEFIEMGASHVIVTSYVFQEGVILWENIKKLVSKIGKERIVIDVSCRKREKDYFIVTNRWQQFTDIKVSKEQLEMLSEYCDEFLVHGVDVEGTGTGMEEGLVKLLSEYKGKPITYAGGISSMEDILKFQRVSCGRLDFTIGSALDLFGGSVSYDKVKKLR